MVTKIGQHNYPDAGSGFFTFFALGLLLMLRIITLLRLIKMLAHGNKKPRRFGRGAGFLLFARGKRKRPNYRFELRFFAFFLDVQLLNMLICAFAKLHMRAYRT